MKLNVTTLINAGSFCSNNETSLFAARINNSELEISPVKVVQRKRRLKIEIYLCLICRKPDGKDALRKPQEHRIQKFIQALNVYIKCLPNDYIWYKKINLC